MSNQSKSFKTQKFLYLHIEGMDLAGKSTATKSVLSRLNGTVSVRHNTIQEKSKFHQIVDDLRLAGNVCNDDLAKTGFIRDGILTP